MSKLVLINADLSQAELRCMALFSNDAWMIDALQEGRGDFFDTYMMPVCFPWIEEKYGSVEKFKQFHPVAHKERRTEVKAVQYGLAFGRGAYAIAKALGLPVKDAQKIIDNYLATASNFAQWREDVKEAAITPAKRELLVNPFGRTYQSEIITAKNISAVQREALSFLPQSTSSDICLTTAIRIHPELKAAGYHIFNVVHDAIMVEGPDNFAERVGNFIAAELRKTGEMVMGDRVPFLSDFSIGQSWDQLS